jgi:hypothetical protein
MDLSQRLHELTGVVNQIGEHAHILLAGDLNAKLEYVSTSPMSTMEDKTPMDVR